MAPDTEILARQVAIDAALDLVDMLKNALANLAGIPALDRESVELHAALDNLARVDQVLGWKLRDILTPGWRKYAEPITLIQEREDALATWREPPPGTWAPGPDGWV